MTNIISHNLQNTNLMISPTKIPPGNSIIDYQQKEKEKEKAKRRKKSKHFCKPLLGILVEFP